MRVDVGTVVVEPVTEQRWVVVGADPGTGTVEVEAVGAPGVRVGSVPVEALVWPAAA